ncbi:MAG: amidophosphoribosyltransferase, partial [Methanothrix sp.]|nr:amidophosphoribosyltransferase [Methanothrix sp.]
MIEDDVLKEYCGLVGIYGDEDAAEKVYLGLYALQHRGQESAGIAASDGHDIRYHKGLGLVRSVFSDSRIMPKLHGHSAIGHNRYSTRGGTNIANAQPLVIQCKSGQLAAAHNGHMVNAPKLRHEMECTGSIFQTTSDSEIVLHLIARSQKETIEEQIIDALSQMVGAYCYVFLTPDKVIAARDPMGNRPLSLGRTSSGFIVASETCAFDIVGAEYIRSLEPGEVIVIDSSGMKSLWLPQSIRKAQCIFEFIYFSRPDSWIFGEVIPIPDSANTAALGYAQASGKRFEIGLIRNHYVGRTFISPFQKTRQDSVKIKFNPVRGVLQDRRVVVVDDSIVRGTTMKKLVRLIREGGAKEVHVRISSPPVKCPCFYGIDISSKGELIGASKTVEEIREFIEADSLRYLSVDGMLATVVNPTDFCTACFTGKYPTSKPSDYDKFAFAGCDCMEGS